MAKWCAAHGHVYDGESNTCTAACLPTHVASSGGKCISLAAKAESQCINTLHVWNKASSVCENKCVAGYEAVPYGLVAGPAGTPDVPMKMAGDPDGVTTKCTPVSASPLTAEQKEAAEKLDCAQNHHVWSNGKCLWDTCAQGYLVAQSGPFNEVLCKAVETLASCSVKDGIFKDGVCTFPKNDWCGWGWHPTPNGGCEKDKEPTTHETLPCEVDLTCPTNPNPNTWFTGSSTDWQSMGPKCVNPGDPGCFKK